MTKDKMNIKQTLLVGSSILALGMSLNITSSTAQTCGGHREAVCQDPDGNNLPPNQQHLCLDPRPANISCTATTTTTPTGTFGGGGGGGNTNYTGNNGNTYGSWSEANTYGGGVSGTTSNPVNAYNGVNTQGAPSNQNNGGGSSGSSGGGGGSGGGYSCMVVTHFYKRGMFTKKEWLINKKDALSGRLSKNTIDGYHVWAPYAVLAMRERPWLEKIFYELFMARTRVIEFEQGRKNKVVLLDKLARTLLEVPSIVIGALGFKPDHDYNYDRIYGTHQDIKLAYNRIYVQQPKGMIGW